MSDLSKTYRIEHEMYGIKSPAQKRRSISRYVFLNKNHEGLK